jgi:protease-4
MRTRMLLAATLALASLAGLAPGQAPGLAAAAAPAAGAARVHGPGKVGLLELEGPLHEQPSPVEWLFGSEGHVTLGAAIAAIDRVAESPSYAGIVVRLKDAELNRTQTEELGAAMLKARKAGKRVTVFGEAMGTPDLLLASYADEVLVQPGSPVMFSGLHAEEMYLADTLAWAGLKADFVQIGDYKGASEQMVNSRPSKAWDENINQLLDSLYGAMRGTLITNRKLDDARLDKAMSELWLADAEGARKAGLADAAVDYPELLAHLDKVYGQEVTLDDEILGGRKAGGMDVANPFAVLSKLSQKPDVKPKKPSLAVLHLDGTIVDGDSTSGGLMGGDSSVGSRTISRMVEELIDEDLIKGVVVRINSPGGSASASEVIWQSLRKLGAKKPVWVSVGSMAASGGYYSAVSGQKIYVNPSSIVGSIGVVGGRLSMEGLYKTLKVNVVDRSRGPRAEMFRSTSPWSPEEVAVVRAKMTETYNQFTARVTAGRPGIDLSKTAEGRLFTGEKAVALKMADKVGGINDCLHDLAASVGLDDPGVMHYPGPKSIPELLEETFGQYASAPGVVSPSPLAAVQQAGAQVFGPAWPSVRGGMEGVLELRKSPVLLMTPSILIVR